MTSAEFTDDTRDDSVIHGDSDSILAIFKGDAMINLKFDLDNKRATRMVDKFDVLIRLIEVEEDADLVTVDGVVDLGVAGSLAGDQLEVVALCDDTTEDGV